tara:strand:- start:9442 stop:9855 length:414 start_codon:yes stop_codon:yes gene_type:complete
MKKWNRTGKIKAVILGLLFLPNIIIPKQTIYDEVVIYIVLGPLVFGLLAIPLITKVNSLIFGQVISRPNWNESPLTVKKPLTFFHFGAFFMLITGFSTILGTLIKYHELNFMGFLAISFGAGILGGIFLTLKLNKID